MAERSILNDGVWAVRGESTDPRPDFIGGTTFEERQENRELLFGAIKEGAVAIAAFYARQQQTPPTQPIHE